MFNSSALCFVWQGNEGPSGRPGLPGPPVSSACSSSSQLPITSPKKTLPGSGFCVGLTCTLKYILQLLRETDFLHSVEEKKKKRILRLQTYSHLFHPKVKTFKRGSSLAFYRRHSKIFFSPVFVWRLYSQKLALTSLPTEVTIGAYVMLGLTV